MVDWESRHNVFFGNMTEGMYAWLGQELGVSTQSLRALEVGWAPVVKFKAGVQNSTCGWFTCPMRDTTGKVIGITVRNQDGFKCHYPPAAGGLGLLYAVNPNHKHGANDYTHGAHNWVRTMDVGIICPVCGKPDGCLLSSEDLADPRAVICRVKQSPRQMKFGWLHLRKEEAILSANSVLNEGPILAVEGMSDVCAAYDLGYTAIGRPGNLNSIDMIAELTRGRTVIAMGELDQKKDGKWPGRDGMVSVYHAIDKTCKASMLMPPQKDLREWKRHGLTHEELTAYIAEHQTDIAEGVYDDGDPDTLAAAWVEDSFTTNKKIVLRRWEDSWYHYRPLLGKYTMMKDEPLDSDLRQWAKKKQCVNAKGVAEKLVADTGLCSNVIAAARGDVILKDVPRMPTWINGVQGPDPRAVVVFSNGILDVISYLEDRPDHLLETTPDFFSTNALPLPFNPAAVCPIWEGFLNSSLGDEPAKIDLLQEWFGYCLTADTSRQKLLYMRGQSGSGKGTIIRVLQALVGVGQYTSTSLAQLAEGFGLAPLVGKLVAVIPDARVGQGTDAMRGLEVLLSLTGEDPLQVNRKYKDQLEGANLCARVTIASNEFLAVPDNAGAMLRRLNIIEFKRKPEVQDITLSNRMIAEVEGIAIWALTGLRRLHDQGDFTQPDSSQDAIQEWSRDTNPMFAWLADCTVDAGTASKGELYDCYSAWAKDTRRAVGTRTVFLRNLVAAAAYTHEKGEILTGISLVEEAAHRYIRKP